MVAILPITNHKIHYNSCKSFPIEMFGPVPETVQGRKQDAICLGMFELVCRSKFSNFAKSWPIELVGPIPETVQDSNQGAICFGMFELVCRSKFSNFAKSWPMELVGPVPETVQDSNQDAICFGMFELVCSLNLGTLPNHGQLSWLDLFQKQCGIAIKVQHILPCLMLL